MKHPSLYHMFRKNGLLLVVSLLILAAAKMLTLTQQTPVSDAQEALLTQWCAEIHSLPLESDTAVTRTDRIKELYEIHLAHFPPPEKRTHAQQEEFAFYSQVWQTLYQTNASASGVHRLIQFAQNGVGTLPVSRPLDYMEQLSYYAALPEPTLLNPEPFDLFFALQSMQPMFLIVVAWSLVLWGSYYESGMQTSVRSMVYGARYETHLRLLLLGVCLGLSVLCDGFDLWYSGIFRHRSALSGSIQSLPVFANVPGRWTIGQLIGVVFLLRGCNLVFLALLTEYIASLQCDLRSTSTFMGSLLLLSLFFTQALTDTKAAGLNWIGYADAQTLVQKSRYLPPLHMTTLTGALLLLLLFISITLLLRLCGKGHRLSRDGC